MADLKLVEAPATTWRVEHAQARLAFSTPNPADLASTKGNRFDVAGAGVLYTATDPAGAFAETLARFRPSASLLAKMSKIDDDGFPAPGFIESSWFELRRLRAVQLVDPLPFVDIDDPSTHTYLTAHATKEILGVGLPNIDVATVRGPDRLVTRSLALWLYAQTTEQGTPAYAGIRYGSRLGPYECWAIFDGTRVELVDEQRIEGQPELEDVMEAFGLSR